MGEKLSGEWEETLEKLYDIGIRRLKRFLGTAKPLNPDFWSIRFNKILATHRNERAKDPWRQKLLNLISAWNIWDYQIQGHAPTQQDVRKQITSDWHTTLISILRRTNLYLKRDVWFRRIDTLRRIWTDTEKQIKGGIVLWTR